MISSLSLNVKLCQFKLPELMRRMTNQMYIFASYLILTLKVLRPYFSYYFNRQQKIYDSPKSKAEAMPQSFIKT